MTLIEDIRAKAKLQGKSIVLAEGTEKRTVSAAAILVKEEICQVTLVGNEDEVKKVAAEQGADLTGIKIVDPATSEWFEDFAQTYCKLREKKGMTIEKARETMKKELYFGVMMVYKGYVDGMVAGAKNTTGDVLRPGFEIIKTKPGISAVSGTFVMITPQKDFGEDGILLFADCAVNPNPTADQLAEFAYCTAQTARDIAGFAEPRVAMLSFSTKGSAKHEMVDKVAEATRIAKEKYPDLLIDGEMQLDAAIVPSVGASKAPGSPVAGRANILIFPDLQAGNACYKAVQRFSGAEAVGPILQGMNKPVNDLSRGCSVDDIVNTVAMVCCQK